MMGVVFKNNIAKKLTVLTHRQIIPGYMNNFVYSQHSAKNSDSRYI